jgi:hypothetical protein
MDVEGGEIPIIVELSIGSDSVEWQKRNRIFISDKANLHVGKSTDVWGGFVWTRFKYL